MKSKLPASLNSICKTCTRKCKQADSVHILACPHFDAQPVQLELKLNLPRVRKKKAAAV